MLENYRQQEYIKVGEDAFVLSSTLKEARKLSQFVEEAEGEVSVVRDKIFKRFNYKPMIYNASEVAKLKSGEGLSDEDKKNILERSRIN